MPFVAFGQRAWAFRGSIFDSSVFRLSTVLISGMRSCPLQLFPLRWGLRKSSERLSALLVPVASRQRDSVMRGAHTAISYATKVSVGLVDLPSIMIDRLSRPEAVVTYPLKSISKLALIHGQPHSSSSVPDASPALFADLEAEKISHLSTEKVSVKECWPRLATSCSPPLLTTTLPTAALSLTSAFKF